MAHEAHNSGLAARYATAIFELAQDEKSLDAVDKDLTSLKAMVAASPDLARLVRAPVFSGEQQVAGLSAILNRMEASPLTRRFILLLSQKRRLFYLTDIIGAFHAMVARKRGEVEASVTSAHVLGEAEIASLKQILKSKLGRDARLEMKVDPRLLGGLVVKVGSRMIDSSLRTKLNGLRTAMKGN